MEKLIELLNEYRTEKLRREMYVNWADKEAIELSEAERINEYEVSQTLDSLNYLRLFIKWLVDNDKIDTDAYKTVYSGDLDKRKTLTMSSGWDEFYQVTEHWVYESLLMLLSISSSPIEDLISYLK